MKDKFKPPVILQCVLWVDTLTETDRETLIKVSNYVCLPSPASTRLSLSKLTLLFYWEVRKTFDKVWQWADDFQELYHSQKPTYLLTIKYEENVIILELNAQFSRVRNSGARDHCCEDKKSQTKTLNFVFIKTLIVRKEKFKSFSRIPRKCFAA